MSRSEGGSDPAKGHVLEQPSRLNVDPGQVANDLGLVVLTLVEFLRQLLERQAVTRMEAGSLSDAEIERLGRTFLELGQEIERLKNQLGLAGRELNLDLGPIGRLL